MRIPTINPALTRATVGLAALVGALGIGVSPAHADETTYSFAPIRLSVYDTEDDNYFPWTDHTDEPRMYYGSAVWAGEVRVGGVITDIPAVDFTGSSISVSLWERDGGWHDHNNFGSQQVNNVEKFLGEERDLNFRGDGWDYRLTYKVIRK